MEKRGKKKINYMQTKGPPANELVNLRLGYPSPGEIPLEDLRQAVKAKMNEEDPEFFMYGVAPGYLEFRERLSDFLTEHYGYEVPSENLMAVNGSAGALDLICKIHTQAGDVVFTENPTYFLSYSTFKDHNITPIEIQMDIDGVNIEAFEEMLRKVKPKFFYTIPVAHNPTGRVTSAAKRKKLVELALKHNFYIVADEVYHLLSFEGKSIPPSFAFFDETPTNPKVLSISSFSKILAPALRLGWIQAHPSLLQPLLASGLILSGGCLNPIICGFVEKAIELNYLKKNVEANKRTLSERCEAMKAALRDFMPDGISFEEPVGGYFMLVRLPSDINSLELLHEATQNHRVEFLAGTQFGKGYDDFLRLSFSYYSCEDIRTGVQRLAQAIRAFLEKKKKQQQSLPQQILQ